MASAPNTDDFQKRFHQRFEELTKSGVPANEAAAKALAWAGNVQSEEPKPMEVEAEDGASSAAASTPPPTTPAAAPNGGGGGYGGGDGTAAMEVETPTQTPSDKAGPSPPDEGKSEDAVTAAPPAPAAATAAAAAAGGPADADWMEMDQTEALVEVVNVDELNTVAAACAQSGSWQPMCDLVDRLFANYACLAGSFLAGPKPAEAAAAQTPSAPSAPPPTAPAPRGGDEVLRVDMGAVDSAFQAVLQHESAAVVAALLRASRKAVAALQVDVAELKRKAPPGAGAGTLRSPGLACTRAVLVLLANPQLVENVEVEFQEQLHDLCALLVALPKQGQKLAGEWFASDLCPDGRFEELVNGLQQFITLQVFQASSYAPSELTWVSTAVRAMQILYTANTLCAAPRKQGGRRRPASQPSADASAHSAIRLARGKPKVGFEDFNNDAINDELFTHQQYMRAAYGEWLKDESLKRKRQQGGGALAADAEAAREVTLQSMISYPFMLTAATKASVLQLDAQHQMHRGVNMEVFHAIFSGQRLNIYLVLRVRRSNIVQDTLQQLARCAEIDFKKPLKVVFEGEEGIDEGGVRKEFMQVVTRNLLDPLYAMFKVDEETQLLYFNPHTFELGLEFELIGLLIGIAIYNSIILDIPFPMVVYKRLKGIQPCLEDLMEYQPTLGNSLKQMKEFEGNVEETFGADFQVSFEVFGGVVTHDLVPGGADIPVTNANVDEYVDMYVRWVLVDSVAQQYEAFEKGFMRVCGGHAIDLFNVHELERLVCGNPTLDFDALERVTHYDDGFDSDSPAIRNFWHVVHAFSDPEKRLLLKFATGSDRAPIKGLASLTFVISRNGGDSDRLPTSHTCFNHLLLPEYSSLEKLEEKLRTAINQSEGFGLR